MLASAANIDATVGFATLTAPDSAAPFSETCVFPSVLAGCSTPTSAIQLQVVECSYELAAGVGPRKALAWLFDLQKRAPLLTPGVRRLRFR